MVKAFRFQGKLPVDSNGRAKPLGVFGTLPVTFAVGGPNPPSGPVEKVMLGRRLPDSFENQGPRWLATFKDVGAGNYSLQITREHGPGVSPLPIVIGQHAPGERTGEALQQVAQE